MFKAVVCCLALLMWSSNLRAEETPTELLGFDYLEDLLPKDEFDSVDIKVNKNRTLQKEIIPFIKDKIPEAASYNINNPEQVFCYHVEKRTKGYTGYTVGNYKIVDYCGELDFDVLTTSYEPLFTRSPNIITTVANCKIEPKVMLRFVRGVDYTDVLLSSPCPSFTVFYAGRYNSFNIKQGIIDNVINQFEKKREVFHSPALIGQTSANGTPKNEDESYQLEKKKKENDAKYVIEKPVEVKEDKPQSGGWGKIKLKM
jgi:hypothetical protein